MSHTSALIVTPVTPDLLFGSNGLERTEAGWLPHRLPPAARSRNTDPQLAMAEAQPSGVRVRFRTRASVIELETLPTRREYVGITALPVGIYDLCVDGELVRQASATGGRCMRMGLDGTVDVQAGEAQTLRFDGLPERDKQVDIWLPHNETTELVALRTDQPVSPTTGSKRVWLHHGSSISQGSNATSPTSIWPAVASDMGGVDLVNLGFGGGALLDPFTARTMRDMPADIISVKIGINLVNTDVMRLRAFGPAVHGFLDTIRDGHPDAPLFVVSPLFCALHETVPGPCQFDVEALKQGIVKFQAEGSAKDVAKGKLTLTVIRDQLQDIVDSRSQSDPQMHYLDGRDLYGEADSAEHPLPDRLHPDTATHHLIGERFAQRVFASGP